jgi:hypothetical protein
VGDPDLTRPSEPRRGLIIFPADGLDQTKAAPRRQEWWLVVAAILLAAALVLIALIVR